MPIRTDKRRAYTNAASIPYAAQEKIQGRMWQIVIAFAVMVFPMLIFSGLLLGLIFHYRVRPNLPLSEDLGMQQDYSDAYLVRISATALITVASWSSTISPILIGFAVTLASYPTAKELLTASEKGNTAQLPTPFQFSLIISTISSGSVSALWNWITYIFGWRGKRRNQVKSLKALTTTLIIGFVLSTLVLATDTWLHFTTKTINFSQTSWDSDGSGLGFATTPNCTNLTHEYDTNRDALDCQIWAIQSDYNREGNEALKLFANASDTMALPVHVESGQQYVYVASPDTSRLSSLDYIVGTYAISSQCMPVTSQCTNESSNQGNDIDYNCPFVLHGRMSTLDVGANAAVYNLTFYTDSAGSSVQAQGSSGQQMGVAKSDLTNPYYYSAMLLTGLGMIGSDSLKNDPDVLGGIYNGGTVAAVFCNSTIYDVTYSSVNGTIKDWKASPSNSTTIGLVTGSQNLLTWGWPYLVQAVSVAGFSNTGQEIADQFALAYSRTILAVTALTFEPRDAFVSQKREVIQVAKVPKIPLYVLIVANLLLVAFGCVLTLLALIALRGNTGEVQARLNVQALVAAAFESRADNPVKDVEDFFKEKHGEQGPFLEFVRTTAGGWSVERHVPEPVPIPEPLQ